MRCLRVGDLGAVAIVEEEGVVGVEYKVFGHVHRDEGRRQEGAVPAEEAQQALFLGVHHLGALVEVIQPETLGIDDRIPDTPPCVIVIGALRLRLVLE